MRVFARKGAVIGAVGFALVLSACGGGDDEEGAGEGESPGAEGPTGAVVMGPARPHATARLGARGRPPATGGRGS